MKLPAVNRAGRDKARAPRNERIVEHLSYGLSLPERTVRGLAGVLGGTLRESAALLLPLAFRNAKTYRIFIGQMLDFMAEDMGGAPSSKAGADDRVENYVARKTVGNFVELASLATFHLSPMLLLAVVSDVAYGSRTYLKELAEELERQGVVEDAASVEHVDDLLDSVASFSERTADAFDTPPVSVEGLRETVEQTRRRLREAPDALKSLPPVELDRLWQGIQSAARREGVQPLAVSGAVTLGALERIGKVGGGALSGARAAGVLLDRHVLDHYREVLGEIEEEGLYRRLAATSSPYVEALWRNFDGDRQTLTERFVAGGGARRAWEKGRGAWDRGRAWLGEKRTRG